jgi:hypothetical protein
MFTVTAFITEVRAAVKAGLSLSDPPSGQRNLLTAMQAERGSFVEDLKNDRLALPLVVIEIGDFVDAPNTPMHRWGLKRASIKVHYIVQSSTTGTQSAVADRVLSLAKTIDSGSYEWFQVIEPCSSIMSGTDAPVNAALYAQSDVQVISAAAFWTPGFLVDMFN